MDKIDFLKESVLLGNELWRYLANDEKRQLALRLLEEQSKFE